MDMTTLYHAIVSLFIPLGWATILYPFYLRKGEKWKKTLLFVIVLSFMTMVVKELIDAEFSVNDVVANILGLFFGTAIVSTLFHFKEKVSSKQNKHKSSSGDIEKKDNETEKHFQGDKIEDQKLVSLRNLVALGAKIHEKGVSLYDGIFEGLSDPKVQELCVRLAQDKREEADKLRRLLFRWPHKVIDVEFFKEMEEEIKDREIYNMHILVDSTERDLLNYAIKQEEKISSLFSSFKGSFLKDPWKMKQLEIFIKSINDYKERLKVEILKLEEGSSADNVNTEKTDLNISSENGDVISLRDRKYPYKAKILIVDDEKEIRDSLKEYLNEDGFIDIDTASNGEEAIEVFSREVYDIVIVDIFMPKKHGIDVLKHVKSVSPSSQVIIVTAKGAQKTVFEAFRLGAFDYIEKPFKYDWLSTLIKKALDDKVFLDEKKESS